MGRFIKNALLALLVGFLIYFLVTRPEDAANIVKGIFAAFEAIPRFFAQLAR